MRIIAGKAKGFRLKAPKGLDVRPTADRVKETLFNILRDKLCDARVLDLFGGTGNLGLEALSRGAAGVVFFDVAPKSLSIIKENIAYTQMEAFCEVKKMDALQGIRFFSSKEQLFDLIFCDPPYNRGWIGKVLAELDKDKTILAPQGVLVVEYSAHELLPEDFKFLEVRRREKFGETQIAFIMRKEE